MSLSCPVDLDVLMLRREVNTMYARVAAAPEGYLPNPTAQNSSLRQQFLPLHAGSYWNAMTCECLFRAFLVHQIGPRTR